MKALCITFIEQIKKKVNLYKYDRKEWFKGSYSTIQRTIRGGLLDDKKEKLMNLLFSSIEKLKQSTPSQENYDKWFNSLILHIRENIHLTFGQSQKIVNILMKYHFCYYYSEFDKKWKASYSWLYPFFEFFHVPIDNVALFCLKQKYGNDDDKIDQNIKAWKYGDFLNGVFYLIENTQKRQVRWSKIENETEVDFYYYIQKFIDKKVSEIEEYRNRLHLEMRELWMIN